MNAGTSVQKDMGPEEQALLANVAALIEQLQSSAGAAPHAEPDLDNQGGPSDDDVDNNPGVMKGSEQGTTPAEPQSVMDPKAAPKDKGMAPWESDDVKKAFATIAKSIQASDTDGVTANDDGETRAEELADTDQKTVNEVAKALMKIMGKKTVAKSANDNELTSVVKSLSAQVAQQGNVIAEMLAGINAASGYSAPVVSQVQKSQGNAPYNGGNMVDVIASSVAKALMEAGQFRQSDTGIPVAKGFTRSEVDNGEAIRSFADGISHDPVFAEKWNLPQ